jgi:peptide-methionine (R)-S-oxide reductase
MKNLFALLIATFALISCNQAQNTKTTGEMSKDDKMETVMRGSFYDLQGNVLNKVEKTTEEWKAGLTAAQFNVLREDGTERSFTSPLLNEKQEGVFTCAACSLPLFESNTKFKSGTGWPSFYQPINKTHVGDIEDTRYGMRRVEVECNRCGSHLGHVFEDGPAPTGLRYCINGVSLGFEPIKLKDVPSKVKKP